MNAAVKPAVRPGQRVAGTIKGQAFDAWVEEVKFLNRKWIIALHADQHVNLGSGFVRDFRITAATVPDLHVTAVAR